MNKTIISTLSFAALSLTLGIAGCATDPTTTPASGESVETVGTTPEQFAAEIRAEIAIMSKVIKAAGIRVE